MIYDCTHLDSYCTVVTNRKFSFTNRIISDCNSLSDSVLSANTVNTFKNRLDRFWKNQEFQFNWKADIDTGSRSKVNVILV